MLLFALAYQIKLKIYKNIKISNNILISRDGNKPLELVELYQRLQENLKKFFFNLWRFYLPTIFKNFKLFEENVDIMISAYKI